jgi:transcription initiation factor TFIIB
LANKIGHQFTLECGHEGVVTWVSENEKTFCVRGTKRKCSTCGKGTGGNWAPTTYIFSEDVEKTIDETPSHSKLKPKLSIQMNCSECGGTSFVRDEALGEVICRTCGCVVVEKLTRAGPEWRAFNNEQRAKRERVGAPVTFTIHDKGLSTFIGKSNRDIYGKNLSSEKRQQIHRLRKWQQRLRVSNSAERNLASALSDLANLSSSMNLPRNVSETASIIYRKALSKRLIRGRSIKSVLTAVLYMSCRLCGVARTLDEFSKSSGLDKK